VFPYVEEHKFFCEYWFQSRFFNKIREFGGLLATHGFLHDGEDVFQLSRHEVGEALEELVLTWAHGGPPRGPHHWPPIVERRRALLERLKQWTPPPAMGTMPTEAINDPISVMLWGITPERLQSWASAMSGDSLTLTGAAASPGVAEGLARVVRDVHEITDVQARRDPRLDRHLARVGADLPEDPRRRDRHRRDHVPRRDRLPRVRAARPSSGPARATARSAPASGCASTGPTASSRCSTTRRLHRDGAARARSRSCERTTRTASAARARASAS
jgi:hypothetical protein